MLSSLLKNLFGPLARAGRRNAAALKRGYAAYVGGEYAAARAASEDALRALPESSDASYLLGLCACATGDPQAAAAALERAVEQGHGNAKYVAALADARLLQQREDDAYALYRRAFPELAREVEGIGEPSSPWKRAHPDWTGRLRNLTLPRPAPAAQAQPWHPRTLADTRATHLLNWALLLIRRRRVRAGMHLIAEALRSDARLGLGHAVLALLHTLDRAWAEALPAGFAARELGAEVFPGATDLCIISAQLGLGYTARELDPVLDWQALETAQGERSHDLLPPVQGVPFPVFAPAAVVYFIACDTGYLTQHAVALACSIRNHCSGAAIHLHLFEPSDEAWAAVDDLRIAVSPLPLSVTWEAVDFESYPGKALYCACARFVRLHAAVQSTANRVVMLDADSLVRGDLTAALADAGDIALVRADDEPPWHRYLAGFSAFRRSDDSARFLRELSAFLAANLANGKARRYLDQIGLYACALRREAAGSHIDHLPIGRFCDTLFTDDALVWSVTQDKDDSRFADYRRQMLFGARG